MQDVVWIQPPGVDPEWILGFPYGMRNPSDDSADSRLHGILDLLAAEYPNRPPMLVYVNPYQLAVAVSLSAQTTDAAVNRTTPELFRRWPDAASLAKAEEGEVEEVIRSLGFFRQKARNLIAAARRIVEDFDGDVPREMGDLISLPGIGRKSANVIRAHVWGLPGIIVDTHFGRVCRRLGLTDATDPAKVERDIETQVPVDRWNEFSMTANYHGRKCCTARKPDCTACPVEHLCPKYGV